MPWADHLRPEASGNPQREQVHPDMSSAGLESRFGQSDMGYRIVASVMIATRIDVGLSSGWIDL